MMDAKLMLLWNSGDSTGTAYVQFATAESANDAISHTGDHPLNGQVLDVKAAPTFERKGQAKLELDLDSEGRYTGKVKGSFTGKHPVVRYQVRVRKLPPAVDEILLREHFQGFGNVASVDVARQDAAFQEDDDTAMRVMELKSLVPEITSQCRLCSACLARSIALAGLSTMRMWRRPKLLQYSSKPRQ